MGAIVEFFGENVSAVDVGGSVFGFDGEVVLLEFAETVFLEVEIF